MIQRFQEFPCFSSLLFIKYVRYFWLHVFHVCNYHSYPVLYGNSECVASAGSTLLF